MKWLESLFAKGRKKTSLSLACEKLQLTSLYSVATLIKMIGILNLSYPKRQLSWEKKRCHFFIVNKCWLQRSGFSW